MSKTDRTIDHAPMGLSDAEVRERVAAGHVNVVDNGPSRTAGDIVRANVVTRFNILLGVMLAVVLLVLREPRDALFGIVLVSNAAIGIIQELRAKRTLDRLELVAAPKARVVRNGEVHEVSTDEIVLDEIVELRSGDQLTVDGIVVTSAGLEINESLLTGESDPIHKALGDECLSGSFVAAGAGRYKATKVGADAYTARLADEAKKFTLVRSELRSGIDWIIAGVSIVIGPMIAALVWSQMSADRSFIEALGGGVAAGVAMVPQGLVLLTSIAFAVGVVRLGRRNVLVQELPAIEGLARVDTVCFDKTGTLTQGEMAVLDVQLLGDLNPDQALAALGADDPNPNATLAAVTAAYPNDPQWRSVGSVPFSSARKWSGATFAGRGTWVLGAPDVLAPRDAHVSEMAATGQSEGKRVLLLATSDQELAGEHLPHSLQPVAVLFLGDQVRPDAAETLRYFADQGVRVKVISGDHPDTVAAIAREVGVVGSHQAMDARHLPEDPGQLAEVMESTTVFGRVTPHQKRAMVKALQARGHVVAMTGDGVNDVLALKDADIGIAVGNGAPASRSVAQLVLLDGQFATLPGVVAEGRRVITNIERVANLFITGTIYAIGLSLAIVLSTLPFPFLPRHLTLVGSLTIGMPAFFLALAPSSRRARPGFVSRVMRFAVPTGLAATAATFAAYQIAIIEDVSLEEARTTATLVLTAIGLFALGIVSRPLVPWKRGLISAMAALLILSMISPVSREFFELQLPRLVVLLAAVGIVAVTGAVMIFSLRAAGWAKQVPEILRDNPPTRPSTWQNMTARITDLSGWKRSSPGTTEMTAITPAPAPAPVDRAAPTVEDPPPEEPELPLGNIEWFDPDEDQFDPAKEWFDEDLRH